MEIRYWYLKCESKNEELANDFYQKVKGVKEIKKDLDGQGFTDVRLTPRKSIGEVSDPDIENKIRKVIETIKRVSADIVIAMDSKS